MGKRLPGQVEGQLPMDLGGPGEVDLPNRFEPSLIYNALNSELRRSRNVTLRGLKIRSPQDLAVAATFLRDRRFETLRYLMLRKGVVVGEMGITSRIPDEGAILPRTYVDRALEVEDALPAETAPGLQRRARTVGELITAAQEDFFGDLAQVGRQLDADEVWMLHNHPSGDPKPSPADLDLTREVRSNLWGFERVRHLVIDWDKAWL